MLQRCFQRQTGGRDDNCWVCMDRCGPFNPARSLIFSIFLSSFISLLFKAPRHDSSDAQRASVVNRKIVHCARVSDPRAIECIYKRAAYAPSQKAISHRALASQNHTMQHLCRVNAWGALLHIFLFFSSTVGLLNRFIIWTTVPLFSSHPSPHLFFFFSFLCPVITLCILPPSKPCPTMKALCDV